MLEFLQANGSWIVFGPAMLVMFYLHRGKRIAGGWGMGHEHEADRHDRQPTSVSTVRAHDRSPGGCQ